MKALFGNVQLLIMMFSDCSKNVSGFIVLGMAAYYFQYIAGNMGMMSMFMLLATVASLAYALLAPICSEGPHQKADLHCFKRLGRDLLFRHQRFR